MQTTQHAMLRRIAGPRRVPDETWLDRIERSTRKAIATARRFGIRIWVEAHLKSKWCWAGHVIRMSPDRLAHRGVDWRDSRWQATEYQLPASLRVRRPGRRRWFRWEDELCRYAEQQGWDCWQDVGLQRSLWLSHCDEVVNVTKKRAGAYGSKGALHQPTPVVAPNLNLNLKPKLTSQRSPTQNLKSKIAI